MAEVSFLSQFNLAVGYVLPRWIWDWAQIVLGLLVLFGVFAQRRHSPRFRRSSMTCPLSVVTVLAGQIGLVLIGVTAMAMVIDGLLPAPAPPRTILVLFMAGFAMVQARAVHDAVARGHHRPEEIRRDVPDG